MRGSSSVILTILSVFANNVDSGQIHDHRRVTVEHGELSIPSASTTESKNSTIRWFTQRLDHFNVHNSTTWQQRYMVNDEFFDKEKRNVAFIMVGGEGQISETWMTNGEWVDNGRQFNAILFQLEHRFYGESRPAEDLSVENLKYLTSQQALADLASFISAMNNEYQLSANVKWIAFGGSYAGSLAAWARLKYPHLIRGAVSTSAPLKAVPSCPELLQVVADDLRNINEDCYKAVQKAFTVVNTFLQNKVTRNFLSMMFQPCHQLENANEDDLIHFWFLLVGKFLGLAKNNGIHQAGKLKDVTLNTACQIMTNSSEPNEIERLVDFNTLMNKVLKHNCSGVRYPTMVAEFNNPSLSQDHARQWLFQTCNEFGFYVTSDKTRQIFGDKVSLDYWVRRCMMFFGPEFNKTYIDYATNRTNFFYGGLDIDVTNVVFVHGSLDPWHKLGITKTINEKAPAIFIEGTAHCANMHPAREDDLPQLKAARLQIRKLIKTWLDI